MIEILILATLLKKETTMYGVHKHVLDNFSPFTTPSFGAIKPALNRLEESGFVRCRKAMSDGGKLSGFYSITDEGKKALRGFMLEKLSSNPLQFFSNSRVKISCASILDKEDREKMFSDIKSKSLEFRLSAESTLAELDLEFYQKIILDNTILEYKNFVSIVEALEKEMT